MQFILNSNIVLKLFIFNCLFAHFIQAQTKSDSIIIEAYLYDKNSGAALLDCFVYLSDDKIETDGKGIAKITIAKQDNFIVKTEKKGYKTTVNKVDKSLVTIRENVWFLKLPMQRANGYLLDISLLDFVPKDSDAPAYGIDNARVEVYNNTLQKLELNIEKLPSPSFNIILEQGNEYIFMVRKKGYYTKRLRANVNVNGCILCMEGFGSVTPNTVQNMTSNNASGALITSVSLKKLLLNETVKIDNIYYDKGKFELRDESIKQLNELGELLRDNPQVLIELNSHTDSRGSNKDNLELSQRRAEAVVAYLQKNTGIDKNRLTAKGYGETKLINSCADNIDCAEELHQPNRRTEFTVVDIIANNDELNKSLASIMQEENVDKILEANDEKYIAVEEEPTTNVLIEKTKIKRPPVSLPFQYTGYKILLMSNKENPSMNESIFEDFEQIELDVDEKGLFLYLNGSFYTEKEAKNYLKSCKIKYPQAKIISYEAGILVK
jgi:outer membrane protein OmpA-like peptidoglycan-associated protein